MPPPRSLTVISLGGGVQSSVMASEEAFSPTPDCAISADTRWESPSIYTHLEWLGSRLRFPLHFVDSGRSLREGVKALTNHLGNRSYVDCNDVSGPSRLGSDPLRGWLRCLRDDLSTRSGMPIRCRRPRRAVAGYIHRRGHQDEAVPRQVDREPLSLDRGGDVAEGLPCVVEGALRQAAGTLGLRRLSLPVSFTVGGDQAPVAGAVRRGG